ncbi:MAG: hypothetical protein ABSH28_20680 [Acidobacteriota bacterium]|jgi:hypothetical protein
MTLYQKLQATHSSGANAISAAYVYYPSRPFLPLFRSINLYALWIMLLLVADAMF